MLIKVYDLRSYMETQEFEGVKLTSYDFNVGVGVAEGKKGLMIIDKYGSAFKITNKSEEFTIGIAKQYNRDKTIKCFPDFQTEISIKELEDNCTFEEIELFGFLERAYTDIERAVMNLN